MLIMNKEHDLNGKTVLLIGSGNDLDGRAMGERIDAGEYDVVARVNKPYGSPADVGTRTDIIFVRRVEWVNYFWQRQQRMTERPARVVAFHDGVQCPRGYDAAVREDLQLPAAKASSGLCAVRWLLERGAKVTIIGFGYKGGVWPAAKVYAQTGAVDENPNFDWAAEQAFYAAAADVTLLD